MTPGAWEDGMTTHPARIVVIVLVVALVSAGWSSAWAAEKVTVGIGGVALCGGGKVLNTGPRGAPGTFGAGL